MDTEISAGVIDMISRAIHSNVDSVAIEGRDYPVKKARNGCRVIEYENVTFMAQNAEKTSAFAALAKQGHKIVWGIKRGTWIYIRDHMVRNQKEDREMKEQIDKELDRWT